MEICVQSFQVRKRRFLAQNHLVEAWNEVSIQEPSVEYGQSHDPANEFEVCQVFRINPRHPVDLKCVIVVCGILEKPV